MARNVVQIARGFNEFSIRPEVQGYQQIAEHFGVTKATVSHYLSILQRLPQAFVTWLEKCDDSSVLSFFTERRLRPVTRWSRSAQMRWLCRVLSQLNDAGFEVDELKVTLRDGERDFSPHS